MAGQGAGAAGPWRTLVAVLVRPGQAFAALCERPYLLAPYATLGAATVVASALVFEKSVALAARFLAASGALSPEAAAHMARVSVLVGTALGAFAPLVQGMLTASLLYLAGLLTGGEARWLELVSAVGYASLPSAAGWLVTGLLRAAVPAAEMPLVTTSAAAFLPREQFGSPTYRLLLLLDPFALWSLGLLVVGYATINRLGRGRAAAVVVPVWLVLGLLYALSAGRRLPAA